MMLPRPLELPRVMLLTDCDDRPVGELLRHLLDFVSRGLRFVVVRERRRDQATREAIGAEVALALTDGGADGLVALASPSGALPAHLKASEPGPHGAQRPWGRSCHSDVDVRRSVAEGAHWVTYSPFTESLSKPGYGRSPARPLRPAERDAVPVYALGGVRPGNATEALRWSGHGVAVMGAVWLAADPGGVMASLLDVAARYDQTHENNR